MSAEFKIGDVVCIAWMPDSRFMVLCVEDGNLWARDLIDGGYLTLALDTCERVR